MAFNTGLSGLRAASVELDVTGNNIANASTVGFKGSKVQFGDLYANGFLSSGSAPVGDGVQVQGVKQSFAQGNISFTDSGLDLAINGDGFFVLNNGGEVRYTRAGQFGINKDGYVVNNQDMNVQGFTADSSGNLSGIRGDLKIGTDNLAPRRTTNLQTDLNLDSRESVLEKRVVSLLVPGDSAVDVNQVLGSNFTVNYKDGSAGSRVSLPTDLATAGGADGLVASLGAVKGVSASARTTVDLNSGQLAGPIGSGNFGLSITVKGASPAITLDASALGTPPSLANLVDTINSTRFPSSDGTQTVSASMNGSDLRIVDSRGRNLNVTLSDGTPANDINQNVDGEITNITLDSGVSGIAPNPPGAAVSGFQTLYESRASNPIITNSFNPLDQRTYNHATATSIFDSLGNSHEFTQYFVKDAAPGNGVGQSQWSVYLQIDGEMIAGTDQQPYAAVFNQSGGLESINGNANGEILITDWVPKDKNGAPNGADGPPADPAAVVTPIPDPPVSSAFVLSLGGTTQYGASFGVDDQRQNGYTTGRLSGLDVSDQGVIFARYTNGQSKSLGQVALASFNNTNGLSPAGDTGWLESFESGQPVIGQPDTGTLGSLKSSSVEESNVDLSAELVNLIIAQRNYQANAKTIETSDAITQTIINLR